MLDGSYEMAVGYGAGVVAPPIAMRMIATAGTAYAMTDPDAWHDVRPLAAPVVAVMLSGLPWARAMLAAPATPQRPLEPAAIGAARDRA